MREFVYLSNKARTSGNFNVNDLMSAGRMDIACHVLINALFISHKVRENTKLHFVFNGPPDPPKHLLLFPNGKKSVGSITLSKKDVANLIRKMLFKYNPRKERTIIEEGFEVEKKSFFSLIDTLKSEGKDLFVLDEKGEDIRKIEISSNPVFILGDATGFNKKELKKLKTFAIPVSVGPKIYFASQVVTIVNNELDRRGV
ncbi:MAG: tRNA (pseudouridine(54)-N(1))-methyltransferase TrmY [Candidatus Pacearchaeota archaeon]